MKYFKLFILFIIFCILFIYLISKIKINYSEDVMPKKLIPKTTLLSDDNISDYDLINKNSGLLESPILFSLPTSIGFSKEIDKKLDNTELIFVNINEKEIYFNFNEEFFFNSNELLQINYKPKFSNNLTPEYPLNR